MILHFYNYVCILVRGAWFFIKYYAGKWLFPANLDLHVL